MCNKEVKVGSLGLSARKRHAGQKKHKENVEASRSNSSNASIVSASASESVSASDSALASENLNSSSISQTSSTSDLLTETRSEDSLTLTEKISNAEVMWSAMIAEHDLAFLTSDHFSKVVPKMFSDSAIAAGFKCCRTKANYLLGDGISVDIQEKLTQSLQDVPFSLAIDESNKQYGKKFLCAMVKFYDKTYNDMCIRFLDICVCNNATADQITKHVVNIIRENNLSFDNLIHVMTDNPNVMRGQFKGVVTKIKSEHANHLVDIGGCSLHQVSNAVKNSLPELYLCNELE